MGMGNNIPKNEAEAEAEQPLIQEELEPNIISLSLIQRTCFESNKLWHIAAFHLQSPRHVLHHRRLPIIRRPSRRSRSRRHFHWLHSPHLYHFRSLGRLENFYYRLLLIMSGYMYNSEVAIDALSICVTICAWESMIPLGFLAATGVRVANELGAGNAKGAKFATAVSVLNTLLVGFIFWLIIVIFNEKLALIFTSSSSVIQMVNELSILLAFTILLNCIQPVLSGVAIGSGRQAVVAYINIGSYYLVGIPLGLLLGWLLPSGIMGMWSGMLSGTVVQTLILTIITMRYDWEREVRKAEILVKEDAT